MLKRERGKFRCDNETKGTHTGGRIAKARFECQTSGLAGLMRVERRSWLNPNPPNRYVRLSSLVKCPAERAVRRPSARIRWRRARAASSQLRFSVFKRVKPFSPWFVAFRVATSDENRWFSVFTR